MQDKANSDTPNKRHKQMSIRDYMTSSSRQLDAKKMELSEKTNNISECEGDKRDEIPSTSVKDNQCEDDDSSSSPILTRKPLNIPIKDKQLPSTSNTDQVESPSLPQPEKLTTDDDSSMDAVKVDSQSSEWSDMDEERISGLCDLILSETVEKIPSHFNRAPQCLLPLPRLMPDSKNLVLFQVPLTRCVKDIPKAHPTAFRDDWDSTKYVKMPCSGHNQIVSVKVTQGQRITTRVSKWELIEESLLGNINSIKSCHDLQEAIKMYNPYLKTANFKSLEYFFNKRCQDEERAFFFDEFLPQLIELTLKLPSIVTQPIPLLKQNQNQTLFLSQHQISCLLANAFFSTFPKRNRGSLEYRNYPSINFHGLFIEGDKSSSVRVEKLRCIFSYLRRVLKETPTGIVSFERRCLTKDEKPNWLNSKERLSHLHVVSKGLIEKDGIGMLQVDFANKQVGGGVLGYGCVQEEILFLIFPELIVSRLFTEQLLDNEVLIISGCEKFNKYRGYGHTFKWDGIEYDETVLDEWRRRCTRIVAMDAVSFGRKRKTLQYDIDMIERELVKSYCGFMERRQCDRRAKSAIATGNWGCGVYLGDPKLKAIIQLMSASQAQRDLVYFTFNDEKLKQDIEQFHNFVTSKQLTVGDLFKALQLHEKYLMQNNLSNKDIDVFNFIYNLD